VSPSAAALVESAHGVAELVEAHAERAEHLRRLPKALVGALRDVELLRMCVPAAYGGPEADPVTMLRAIEAVASADGAAGWCTMIASTTSSLSMYMQPEFAAAIFGDRRVVTGGVFAPNGQARCTSDGWTVDGRWMWGSGTSHCQWICGGARADDGAQHVMFFPAADVTIHDTWFTSGLRGTGSNEFSVSGATVPRGRTYPVGGRPVVDCALAAFPNFTLLAIGVAAVALGIARHAIDEFVDLANDKRPQFSQRTIAQVGSAQTQLARTSTSLAAARALLVDEVGSAWEAAAAGGRVSLDQRARIRLAGAHAAETAAVAVGAVYTMGGGSSIFDSSALQRCLRDVHVVTQHIMVAPRLYETLGKHLFGAEIDAAML
jgi:indole-3-acetate monooxygenase